jgi:hypothetical protein
MTNKINPAENTTQDPSGTQTEYLSDLPRL